jgi:hypothetical protein
MFFKLMETQIVIVNHKRTNKHVRTNFTFTKRETTQLSELQNSDINFQLAASYEIFPLILIYLLLMPHEATDSSLGISMQSHILGSS